MGGARQGVQISEKSAQFLKIGARKQLFLKKANRDRPGTQSRTNFACFGTTFSQSGSSRDPVGIQSGSSRDPVGTQSGPSREQSAPLSGTSQNHKKLHFCRVLARFGVILAASRQVQKRCEKFQNWVPTGPDWIPTGSRLDPDWIPTSQNWCQKIQIWCGTASHMNLRSARNHPRPPLPLFSRAQAHPCRHFPFPGTSRAPTPPLWNQNATKRFKPNGGSTNYTMLIYLDCLLVVVDGRSLS